MSVSVILVTRYYNNMRDSGLLLFVSLFPYPSCSQTCAYVMCVVVNVPGVTSMGHEVRESYTKKRAVRYIHVKKCFYFILFYFILFYFVLFYFILFYFILFYFILFYFILLQKKIFLRYWFSIFLLPDIISNIRSVTNFIIYHEPAIFHKQYVNSLSVEFCNKSAGFRFNNLLFSPLQHSVLANFSMTATLLLRILPKITLWTPQSYKAMLPYIISRH
jgi:hypothetical protein